MKTVALEGKIDLDNLLDIVRVLYWLHTKKVLVRGGKEHAGLTWDWFIFPIYDLSYSKLYRKPMVQLKSRSDKKYPLTITIYIDLIDPVRNIHVCSPDDPIDLYLIIQKYRMMCHKLQVQLYYYRMSEYEMKKREKYVLLECANLITNRNRPASKSVILK